MKAFSLVLPAVLMIVSASATQAQSDTAHHRAAYDAINAREDAFQKVSATYKDDPTEFILTGWLEDGKVRKIVAKNGDDGDGVEEYYLENEQPLFVYNTYTAGGMKVVERLYFKDGNIFKWLTTEKPAPVFHGEDYATNTERILSNTTAFVAALKQAAGTAGGKAPAQAAAKNKVVEGTFVGVEEGDYFHWNMKDKAGEDVSFFILQADASVDKVLENAAAYAGKKCRVTVKKSKETIPEAGGKIEVEQILSVEWVGKK